MKAQMQAKQSQEYTSESSGNGAFGRNNENSMLLAQASPKTIREIFTLIVAGHLQEAKYSASETADRARLHKDNQTVQWAGKVWTVANLFADIQRAIADEAIEGITEKAALAGNIIRSLIGSRQVAKEEGERALQSAGAVSYTHLTLPTKA